MVDPTPIPTPTPTSWLDALPAELKTNPALTKHKDVAALAGEHVNLQSLIGKKGVIPPGDKDGAEAWGVFYNQLGRPDKAEGYEFKKPEGVNGYSEDTAKWFRAAAHKHGLSARTAAGLHDEFVAFMGEALKGQETAAAQSFENGSAALKAAWGLKHDAQLENANRVVKNYPGLADELKALKLQNAPALAQALALLGELTLEEDKLVRGGRPVGGTLAPDAAKAEIAKINGAAASDQKHPLWDKTHPEHQAVVDRLEQLHKMQFPAEAA